MSVEQQYIDLFSQTEAMICRHSAEVLNAPRAVAFADFERLGFPTRKEAVSYTHLDVYKRQEPIHTPKEEIERGETQGA